MSQYCILPLEIHLLWSLSIFPVVPLLSTNDAEIENKWTCWALVALTPIILATQEAEIRRIAVQSQPGQILKTLSWKNLSQK
jgi:hypothetical protein